MKNLKNQIAKAGYTLSPVWPLQTSIARNPLQGLECLPFEEALFKKQSFSAYRFIKKNSSIDPVNQEMIKWCQVFLDEGQSKIGMPEREKGFYHSWSLLAPYDKKLNPSQKNQWLFSLPTDPVEAITRFIEKLNIEEDEIEQYFTYCLQELPGWAGYVKWLSERHSKESNPKNPIDLTDFLAVRLAITCSLKDQNTKNPLKSQIDPGKKDTDFFEELQKKEHGYLSALLRSILSQTHPTTTSENRRDAQFVFCIDVRSEPLRMRIEKEGNYETLGFAGFFGLPISIDELNTDQVKECCPVLLKPKHHIYQIPQDHELEKLSRHQNGKKILDLFSQFYKGLKFNFGTPFALAETLGLWCGFSLAAKTLCPQISSKIKKFVDNQVKPIIATQPKIDIPLSDQITYAESALSIMGLTKNFSPIVVFCGHGSQTENNPYASALDCGACGGNHGGTNGQVLSSILNSKHVRSALKVKGILIPDDTTFIGAQHNTTTDEVVLYDACIQNSKQKKIVAKLKEDLKRAGLENSKYRCLTLGLNPSKIDVKKHVCKRSLDWAEVRPEWGLARNAAFIIGHRNLTKDLNLEGRCFLHSYNWQEDNEGKCLETILTAPVVVAEWINTQYFFSTIDNTSFGSGSKITHNITGTFSVMQGNGSDLMDGLPFQSVHINDEKAYHDPMRLQVIVYAPISRIEKIIQKHSILQTLFFNKWVILTAIDPLSHRCYRLIKENQWEEIFLSYDMISTHKDRLFEELPTQENMKIISEKNDPLNSLTTALK